MAEHRIRRWLQFGILDLLIVTAVVAVVISLCQPIPQGKTTKALPWVIGGWTNDSLFTGGRMNWMKLGSLQLYPDGLWAYSIGGFYGTTEQGADWKLKRIAEVDGAFVLICGDKRFVIRSEWGSGVMEVLNAEGSVEYLLLLVERMEGPMHEGMPHGTWTFSSTTDLAKRHSVEYREGETIDYLFNGKRFLGTLNSLRRNRGFPPLTERDFPPEGHAGRESP
jgi:hypothetical protein